MAESNQSGNRVSSASKTDHAELGEGIEPQVAAIVAVHNRLALTRRCFQTLTRAAIRTQLQIVLVDDGSTDGTAEWVSREYPGATILRGNGQLWFGGCIEAGLDHVFQLTPRPSHVLILNNDSFMRPGALDEMVAASAGEYTVAAAYWDEDIALTSSAGYRWHATKGLLNVCDHADWQADHVAGFRRFLPVEAVATTACLYPTLTLARAARVNLNRHRQNRYDAVLSANLRAAGARFLVSTHFLADHLYGPLAKRPPRLRSVSLREFFRLTLLDPLSVYHVPHTINALWVTAPSRRVAIRLIADHTIHFVGQIGGKLLQALLALVGIRFWLAPAGPSADKA